MFKSFCLFINFLAWLHYVSDDYILLIDKLLTKHPGTYVAIPSDKEGRKFIVDSYSLHKYYIEYRAAIDVTDFRSYLKRSIEKGVIFKADNLTYGLNKFPVHVIGDDIDVLSEYRANGISFIKKKYFREVGNQDYSAKRTSDDTLYGLIYIMAQNQYIIGFSDYSGSYIFRGKAVILARAKKDHRI